MGMRQQERLGEDVYEQRHGRGEPEGEEKQIRKTENDSRSELARQTGAEAIKTAIRDEKQSARGGSAQRRDGRGDSPGKKPP
jgi:hypothetical protein